jgi:PAS domain S-box-containing protein
MEGRSPDPFEKKVGDVEKKVADEVRVLEQRMAELREIGGLSPEEHSILAQTFEELHTTLEELQVAEEELRAQNEELEGARQSVEVEHRRYLDLFELAPDGYLVTDMNGTIREANRAAALLLGADQAFLVGKPMAVFIGKEDLRAFRSGVLAAQDAGVIEWEFPIHPRQGDPFDAAVRISILRSQEGKAAGMRWLVRDITSRKRAEDWIKRLNENLEQRVRERTVQLEDANRLKDELLAHEHHAREEAESAWRSLAFLTEASTVLATPFDYDRTLQSLARLAVPALADWCAVHVMQEDTPTRFPPAAAWHTDSGKIHLVERLFRRLPQDLTEPYFLSETIGRGRSVAHEDPEAFLGQSTAQAEQLQALRTLGFASAMTVPLIARGRTLGAILLVSAHRRYTSADITVAEDLARHAALVIDNARMYLREHRIAEALQRGSLPKQLPRLPGVLIHASYLPAGQDADVGGDWYDAFPLPDGRLAFSVGDVSGHGLSAAAVMTQVRQAIRTGALEGDSPGVVLARVRELMELDESDHLITALFGVYDPVAGAFVYASAGHHPPILASPPHEARMLMAGGIPLGGAWGPDDGAEETVEVPPGGLLVLYTDGLVEQTRDLLQGQEALLTAVRRELAEPSRDPADAIRESVLAGAAPRDDVAILTLSRVPFPLDDFEFTLPARASAAGHLRRVVRRFGKELALDEQRIFDLQVAVGEAFNNVVEHAYGGERGVARVHGYRQDEMATIEVEDYGRWRPKRDETRTGGLDMMQALADILEVERDRPGTKVRVGIRVKEKSGVIPAPK